MATATKGEVRWCSREINGNRRIRIQPAGGVGKCYEVEELKEGGFKLHRMDPKTFLIVTYTLVYETRDVRDYSGSNRWLACDCDSTKRVGKFGCKHSRGLTAGLRQLKD